MDDPEAQLIAEQFKHTVDLLRAEIAGLRSDIAHLGEISNRRLDGLEKSQADMETRLRAATDGVAQFKVWSGLSNGASSLISLFALFRTFMLGG